MREVFDGSTIKKQILEQKMNREAKLKLANWFEIDELEYCQYVRQGYEITASERRVAWWLNDKLHRIDGPAIIWANGTREWWLNNKRHRTDGPAAFNAEGDEWWYLNGMYLTEEEWRRQVEAEQLV